MTSPQRAEPEFDVRGPTAERIHKADHAYVVGGQDRGTKIYFFADSPCQRLYARLRLRAGQRETDQLTIEYVALQKYRHHWYHAGLEAPLASVDPNRVFASDPGSMSGMAKSERQYQHRLTMRRLRDQANPVISHKAEILLDNFVCYEHALHISGYTIGYSVFRARKLVRESAQKLADHWGVR